jgi:pyruvate dehydrogenase E2 component (dihydrolipoamide acetyltransferase)
VAKEFKLPDLGEGVESGEVARVLVSEGDQIEAEQTILELETDKALVEVPSPEAGKVVSVQVKDGDTVPVGAVLITYEASGTDTGPAKEPPAEEAKPDVEPQDEASEAVAEAVEPAKAAPAPAAPRAPAPPVVTSGPVPAAPATRRFARELGVDLATISGTGAGGRITRDDVKAHVQNSMIGKPASTTMSAAPADLPDFSKYGDVERQKLSKIRRVIATNLHNSWTQIPHVTQFDRADVTELEAFRQRHKDVVQARGGRLTPTVLILKAVINALKAFPQFNSSLDVAADELVLKQYYNIGIAVDSDRGLLVPVIRDADRKDITDLSIELNELADRTRSGKAELSELQGGSFTITNLGSISGTAFTPIVNHPEVAILGIAQSREEAVVLNGRVEPRLIMPLCLSYDHRVIDGADGARFTKHLAESLEDPERLLLGG